MAMMEYWNNEMREYWNSGNNGMMGIIRLIRRSDALFLHAR
jgi:hypothetical protein